MSDGKEGWVRFKYERLPNICFWCGKLTHSDKECPLWEKSKDNLKAGDQQFGSWLRASTPNPFRRTVIRVAGFDEDELSEGDGMHADGDRAEAEPEQNGHKEGDDGSLLKDIDEDLAKFNNVEFSEGVSEVRLANSNLVPAEEFDTNGLALLGPDKY
nr:hypothetical protein CFP56_66598 [Quercus suber]